MNTVTFYNTIVGSTQSALEKAKVYGDIRLRSLTLYTIIGYLQGEFKDTLSTEDYNGLEFMMRALQNNTSEICSAKGAPMVDSSTGAPSSPTNIAPVIGDTTISYDAAYYDFTKLDFISNFTDANGDKPNLFYISAIPAHGTLKYNGTQVSAGFTTSVNNIGNLRYTRTTNTESQDTITYKISDNNINTLYSNMAVMTMNINQVVNQPPTQVGVNSTTIASKGTRVFTSADFTTNTTPVYSDPEGDSAEAVKITVLPSTGSLYLGGVAVKLNQNISIANINNSLFTFVANQTNLNSHSVTFNFSVSDVGSHSFTTGGVFTINVASYINQAPVIGDGSLSVNEGLITTFTRVDFTSNTTPPYSDPEGDAAWKLKITVLPATGVIKLNNVAIVANDEILFSDIDLGLLTYTQAANAGGTIPDFVFGIADQGSMTFTF